MKTQHNELQRALKQIRNASDNFHTHANRTGDASARQANLVLARLAQCLEHGSAYQLTGIAEEFDRIIEETGR